MKSLEICLKLGLSSNGTSPAMSALALKRVLASEFSSGSSIGRSCKKR